MIFSRFELLLFAAVAFVFYLYAILWMREMRSEIKEINIRLLQQMELSQRQHRESMRTGGSGDALQKKDVEKLPPIKE